jgi:hypothetical protein
VVGETDGRGDKGLSGPSPAATGPSLDPAVFLADNNSTEFPEKTWRSGGAGAD